MKDLQFSSPFSIMLKTNLHMLVYTIKIRLIMISTEHRMTFLLNLIDITCWHCHSAHCDDRKHKALLKVYHTIIQSEAN